MQKKHLLAVTVALALLAATPSYADSDQSKKDGFGLHLGSIKKVLEKEHTREKRDKDHATSSASVTGIVTSVSGGTFTITRFATSIPTNNVFRMNVFHATRLHIFSPRFMK